MRFDVKDYQPTPVMPAQHAGDCMVDDGYDGRACCPLGDVEAT